MDDSIPPPAIRLRSPLKSRLPAPPPEQGDLFATGDAGEEGYLKWKAETAMLREAESHGPVLKQASLEAQGDDSGHALWQAEREQERRKFEERWAVPLGHRVRVSLEGEMLELEGRLFHDETSPADRKGIMLRIGSRRFFSSEIQSLVRVDG